MKVEINHVPSSGGSGGPNNGDPGASASNGDKLPAAAAPDSSIGEGMDITIQGANGHVNNGATNGGGKVAPPPPPPSPVGESISLRSHDSVHHNMDMLAVPGALEEKLNYSDMSIGMGMDISIRGSGGAVTNNEPADTQTATAATAAATAANGEKVLQFDNDNSRIDEVKEEEKSDHEGGSINPDDLKNVMEVLYDPVDEIVVEDCCPEVCYRICPCCIGDLDSPFWQLWYKHRLQVSR